MFKAEYHIMYHVQLNVQVRFMLRLCFFLMTYATISAPC